LTVNLNLNLSKISDYTFMIEFISILCKGLFESYFLITFRLSLSSIFFIEEREEMLVLDLLNEYTLSFLLYLVVEVEVKPLR